MIVDTSAIMAIVKGEADGERYAQAMLDADTLRMSAGNRLELTVVTTRAGDERIVAFAEEVVAAFGIVIEPVTAEQGRLACEAFRTWGQTRHRAKLNFGDCFAYALAIARDEPLLFKGNDFRQTDVRKWDRQ